MTKKAKRPRAASTYRAARRNQALRVDRTVWRGTEATYRPFQIKPPVFKIGPHGPYMRMRKQPKVYKLNGERECMRRAA